MDESSSQAQYHHFQLEEDPLQLLYEIPIRSVAGLVRVFKLVRVPEGPLCLAPALCSIHVFQFNLKNLFEFFRIWVTPSMNSLELIADCPADYHMETG